MQAHEEAFAFIRKESFYTVPFFQRNYVWTYNNWEELLSNLLDTSKCSFLGSIILKQINTKSGETGCFSIVDGQQRLTTLSILMRACYDRLMQNKENYPEKAIMGFEAALDAQLFVTTDPFTGEKEVKIIHSHIDRPSFESVINGKYSSNEQLNTIVLRDETTTADGKQQKENAQRILLCYKFFRKQLDITSVEKVQKLWNTLIKDDVKFLVNIDLLAEESEQAIFDAVNSSGVRLTSSDTIKNALFQRYIDIVKVTSSASKAEKEAIELYDNSWVSVFMKTVDDSQYWETQHQSGRLFRDNIEILLHCVAVIDGFFNPQEMKMSELAQCYKEHIKSMTAEELKAFILRIKDYAELYHEKIVTNESSVLYSYDEYFTRLIHILDTLEISTFHPYLLLLLYNYRQNPNDPNFKTSCKKLEKYILLHAICNASTKNYNKECIQLIGGDSIDTMLANSSEINNDSFTVGLHKMYSNKNAALILFWVELYKRSMEKIDQTELKYTYSLEHIMPQKWQEYWGVDVLPVLDESGNAITDKETAEQTRMAAIYEIGNMTLLNSRLNTSLRNFTFDRKRDGEGRKRGMKDLADCLVTREILSKPRWSETEIATRTNEITKDIKAIWDIAF